MRGNTPLVLSRIRAENPIVLLLFFAASIAGCDDTAGLDLDGGDTDNQVPCDPETLLACSCGEGAAGFAYCEDGTWSECECDWEGEFPPFCGLCHGEWTNPAPPVDLSGNNSTELVTVGAHRTHLQSSDWHRRVGCNDCHMVPTQLDSAGHLGDPPVELTFGPVASAFGATPSHEPGEVTCTGVHCHGNAAPDWTAVGQDQASCGSCHALPPAAPHPDSSSCADCHGDVVDSEMTFVDPSLHVDGKVQLSDAVSCTLCHGGVEDNPAPPLDASGNASTDLVTVGAHQAHLVDSDWHRDVQCGDCHSVPSSPGDGHNDGSPAEMVWGTVASAGGAEPAHVAGLETCAGVHCHGAGMKAGVGVEPDWTAVGQGEAACGTCHSIPPSDCHPDYLECEHCHGDVIGPSLAFANPDLHINGEVNVDSSFGCSSCHGGLDNAAPPLDASGNTDTSLVSVGAHQAHLASSDWRAPIGCEDCHEVPLVWNDGHADGTPAEISWGAVASADSATPSHVIGEVTCAGVYCHGSTLNEGGSTPDWTMTGAGEAACGTCHGIPPAVNHPSWPECSLCHSDVIGSGNVFIAPWLHIDGILQN